MNTKQLKQKILSLAITGRLVPQDPRDEPASELLHRINPKATPLETDQPLPEGWCATNLSTLCELADGESVQNRELINLDAKFLRGQREGNKLKSGKLVPAGSLLILVDGENSGEVFRAPIEGYQGSTFRKLVIDKNMHEEFVLQVINSHRTRLKGNKKGSAIPHLNKKLFREIQVPIPPLSEQRRIANAVELWFAKIDQLEHDCEALSKFGKQVRKKLLTSAIAGRLVPQDSNDEPASELLHRINPKATPLQDDVPYEIPDNWAWCKLRDICVFLSRGKSPKYSEEKKYPVFAQKCNLKDGWISLDNARFLDPATIGKWHDKYKLQTGDVLVNSTGTGTVCRTRLFDKKCLGPYPFVVPDSHVSVVRTHEDVSSYFILHYMSSHRTQQYLEDNLAGSTNQKELYIGVLENLPVPLPPLAEQKRIVEKLESMFAVLDNLDALIA